MMLKHSRTIDDWIEPFHVCVFVLLNCQLWHSTLSLSFFLRPLCVHHLKFCKRNGSHEATPQYGPNPYEFGFSENPSKDLDEMAKISKLNHNGEIQSDFFLFDRLNWVRWLEKSLRNVGLRCRNFLFSVQLSRWKDMVPIDDFMSDALFSLSHRLSFDEKMQMRLISGAISLADEFLSKWLIIGTADKRHSLWETINFCFNAK